MLTILLDFDWTNCRLPTTNCQLPLLSLRALLVWRRSANALLTSVGNSTITSASTACIKALVVRSVSCQWRLSDSNKWPRSRELVVRSDSTSPCAAFSCPSLPPLGRLSDGGWVAILRRCIHSYTYFCCHQLRSRELVVPQRFNIAVAPRSRAFRGIHFTLFSSNIFACEGIGEESTVVVMRDCVHVCLVCVCSSLASCLGGGWRSMCGMGEYVHA